MGGVDAIVNDGDLEVFEVVALSLICVVSSVGVGSVVCGVDATVNDGDLEVFEVVAFVVVISEGT